MEAASSFGRGAPAGTHQGAGRVEAMVARHGPALLRVANQFSLCPDDALDAYQRALEIYLRRLDTVDRATEGAWLRVVVKHEAMAIRRGRQESVDREEPDLDASAAGLRDVEDQVAGGERVDRSVEALRALKPDEAKALMLKAQGLSYQEIGRRFGWTYTKVNRSITEGRARFLKNYRRIEQGEACEPHAEAIAALATGTATRAQLVALRPHLRHCAACRARVRDLRFSRTRRLALVLPWLHRLFTRAAGSDVSTQVQYATASGGGRLGPAVTLIGLCLGGVSAGAVCVSGGVLPAAPLIHHAASAPKKVATHHVAKVPPRRPEPARRAEPPPRATLARAAATPTPPPPRTPARATAAAAATRHRATAHKSARRREFGFEGNAPPTAPATTPPATASPATATTASVGGGSESPGGGGVAGGGGRVSSGGGTKPAGGEFGFEGG